MTDKAAPSYSPQTFKALTFFDARSQFEKGTDTPRDYLERCLATIQEREPVVKAWVVTNEESARAQADASAARYKAGAPLSPIDGLVMGIKDLHATKDMPTQLGSRAYEGNFPKNDDAPIQALRDAGAIILGKAVTTELGASHPGPTTNPFDPNRTPGGSSSGSAALVGARMAPAALGSQVGGSIIRPASYCGNYALKPSQGALNRGQRQGQSQSVIGVHAGSLEDVWSVAIEIASRVGGDPGHPGLAGPQNLPSARKPERLIVLETEGWANLDDTTKEVFEDLVDRIGKQNIQILRRKDDPLIEGFEQSIASFKADTMKVRSFENRWVLRNVEEEYPGKLSWRLRDIYHNAQSLTQAQYRYALQLRENARRRYADLRQLADGFITLSSIGIAPIWKGDIEGEPLNRRPTGDVDFNAPASGLGCPAVNVPLMAINGMPLGLQVMGQRDDDAATIAISRWIADKIEPVVKN